MNEQELGHANVTTRNTGAITVDVAARAEQKLLILPHNWGEVSTVPTYVVTTESILKLLSQEQIPVEPLTPITSDTLLVDARAQTWIGPTILISGLMLSRNPVAVSLALNMIGEYVVKLFEGARHEPNAVLRIIQTSCGGESAREIEYKGPASKFDSVESVLSEFLNEDQSNGE